MRYSKLQDHDKIVKKLRSRQLLEGWRNIKAVFYYQSFIYFLKVIYLKLIKKYYDNLFRGHFDVKKIQKLKINKYYQLTQWRDIKTYINGYNICLILKKTAISLIIIVNYYLYQLINKTIYL